MEVKKSPKADLEGRKGLFFEIGLLLAVGILLYAFEWKTESSVMQEQEVEGIAAEEEEAIPITQHLTPPPPPPPPAPKLTDIIDIVENDQDIDEDLELEDVEDDTENTVITNTDNWGDWGDGGDTGESEIFQVVEDMPYFPEGNVTAWINKRIKYPPLASENGIQGKVFVKFVIDKDGTVTNAEIVRGVDPSLDKEALRVINSMPKWRPGKQRGKSVRVAYNLFINFQLSQ